MLDPASAPPRPDLTFLRRRTLRKPATNGALGEFISGHATHARHDEPTPARPAAPSRSLDPSRPARPSGSLDLSEPAAPRPAAPAPSSSLDLSDAPAPPAAAAPASAPRRPATPTHQDRRINDGAHQLLSVKEPTVTLTRVQSGIGQLQVEAVCSPEVGDLRLGAAYQLADGTSSTVQYAGGNRFAPSSRRPVIVAGRDEYEHLRLDLRQARELERLAVYAFSESRAELRWGGTLVITTFGGSRMELPLETLHPGKVGVLLSIYNLDGEFVVRAEMETITGDVREAARGYGYDRITWRDERSPVG
jgi:uncharacterized protein involved in tellurium resistance